MENFKLDICDIRKAALEWREGRKPSLREFLDFVVRLAQDSGYSVTGTISTEDFLEVQLSTAEVIQFSRPELR
jgi:hypothetical protein